MKEKGRFTERVRHLRDSTLQHGDISRAHNNVAEVKPYSLEVDTLCCCKLLRRKNVAPKAIQKLGKSCNDALAIWAFHHLQHVIVMLSLALLRNQAGAHEKK